MLKSFYKKSAGFTFTELLIAMTINTLLLAALISAFVGNLNQYKQTIRANRLNQQLQTAMDIMTTDIRRAGYWNNANSDVGLHQNNNPFMASGADLSISGSCIIFTYDRDRNNSLPSINSSIDDERYGFRLTNQTLQARPPGAALDCASASNTWENITDPTEIQITSLSFTLSSRTVTTGPGTKSLIMRSVDISMTGQLTSDNTITKTLTQHVRIRNDKFSP